MFRRHAEWLAEAQPPRLADAFGTNLALGLVGGDDDRRVAVAQPAGDFLVNRGDAGARIDQEQRDIGHGEARLSLRAHPPRQGRGVVLLETGGVDYAEIHADEMALALAAIARHAGRVIDQREFLADQAVEQGGLADVRPPDDDNRGEAGASFHSIVQFPSSAPRGDAAIVIHDVQHIVGDHRRHTGAGADVGHRLDRAAIGIDLRHASV